VLERQYEEKSREERRRGHHRDRRDHRDSDRGSSRHRSDRHSERSSSRERRHRSRSPPRRSRRRSPSPVAHQRDREITQEDRDVRTVVCMNLSNKASERDLKEFFRDVGRIRSVKVIRDSHTGKSKGVCYIEFIEIDSVNRAVEMTGKKLFGHSIIVETSQAEKNREYAAHAANVKAVSTVGGRKIRVQNVHKGIDANMLRDFFQPYGNILECIVSRDDTSPSGTQVAFITYSSSSIARKVATDLNGFKLANYPLQIKQMNETSSLANRSVLDTEVVDRGGVNLGRSGRYELMSKLAEGSGMSLPDYRNSSASAGGHADGPTQVSSVFTSQQTTGNLPTQCLVVSNFFDGKKPMSEADKLKIKDEVIDQCNKHGGVFHVVVDDTSRDGNVYFKCQTVGTAIACFATFNDKVYNNRTLSAIYLPISNYHDLFPEASRSFMLLSASSRRAALSYL